MKRDRKSRKLGLIAIGRQVRSTTDVVSNINTLEGKVDATEIEIALLKNTITSLLSHTHTYEDDNGTETLTKTTSL